MQVVRLTYYINAPISEVWKALVDPKYIDEWGGGVATMDEKAGTKFKLWDGDIHGTNKEVVKEKILAQDWYSGDWKKPSRVTFLLKKIAGKQIRLDLLHKDIPDKEVDDIEDGWKRYYLGPMKKFLEKEA